ncbi:hypothetical protein V6Z11_D01G147300 [Gossypium hirsutum]
MFPNKKSVAHFTYMHNVYAPKQQQKPTTYVAFYVLKTTTTTRLIYASLNSSKSSSRCAHICGILLNKNNNKMCTHMRHLLNKNSSKMFITTVGYFHEKSTCEQQPIPAQNDKQHRHI